MLKILISDKTLEFCNLWPYRRRHEYDSFRLRFAALLPLS